MITNIIIRDSHGDSFSFNLINKETIELFCYNRDYDLIEGLIHELVECIVISILLNKFNISMDLIRHGIHKENSDYWKIGHLLTVYSMEYYSLQLKYKDQYEAFFKGC